MNLREARWLIPGVNAGVADRLARELGISALAARILVQRGYTEPAQAEEFLRPGYESLLDPFELKGMESAVERLVQAVRAGERILLYGDYDVDGTSSIVILTKALEIAGAKAEYYIPHRLREGYGMRPEVVEKAAADGFRLIISVDTGIRATDVVRCANQLGIDSIITDHHLPESEVPPARAVLNPNQPGCGYRNKNLCGAGVAFKLAQAMLARMGKPAARVRRLSESFLKLVAIATVADVAPLVGENRAIVRLGLSDMARTPNVGLRALLEVAGFNRESQPNAGQVAFRIAPRMNAAGRMASARDVVELFLTSDADQARKLASRLNDWNAERQQTEADMLSRVLEQCEATPVDESRRGLVFAGPGWHRGVAGIVASRLVERFCRPVFVLGIDEEKGEAQGSGRSVPAFHLLEGLESMAELFTKFGGHRQAAGVTLEASRVEEFSRRFNAVACQRLTVEDLCWQYQVDAEARLDEITPSVMTDLQALAPFGCGNPAPLFLAQGVTLPDPPVVMAEKHLRCRLKQNGWTVTAKAWNWAEQSERLPAGKSLEVLFTLEEDSYTGFSATIKDVRACQA